jgi:spermidine synthase
MQTSTPPLTAIGLISAAGLAYEILLTRVFAIVHWHHLVAIAISLALLGYGASGTFLTLLGARLRPHFAAFFVGNALLFAISSLACLTLAQSVPLDPQGLAWDSRQVLYLAGTFLVLAVPFFAAANCVGATLWQFRADIPRIYGFDLMGAGLGAFLPLAGLVMLAPADALFGVFVAGALVAILAAATLRWYPVRLSLLVIALTGVAWSSLRPAVEPAVYKDLTQTLAVQGATIDSESSGVDGVVSVVRNDQVPQRFAPGLSLNADRPPPKKLLVFLDGDAAGAIDVHPGTAESDAYFGQMISALPFALLAAPRVAVINAGVGFSVQQAAALGAAEITAIEPNRQLYDLACVRYRAHQAAACDTSKVHWHIQSSRAFLAGQASRFDLITLGVEADPGGVDALSIDYDLTAEAFTAFLRQLDTGGLLAIEGPTRLPPRLAMRVLQTARRALLASGVEHPEGHIAMIRGWQRFLVMASNAPLAAHDHATIRGFANSLGFDLIWLSDIRADEVNRFQVLNQPLFYAGAARLLDPLRAGPIVEDRHRLEPVGDERPFPMLFTTWDEFRTSLVRAEPAELAQLDSALLISVVTLGLVSAAGVVLILLPLSWMRPSAGDTAPAGLRIRTLLYFSLIGLAFLFLELAWIQRLQLFLGHPVYATTAVLAAFLVFAGLGSFWSQRRTNAAVGRLLGPAVLVILAFSLAYVLYLPGWLEQLAGIPLIWRILLVLFLLAPLAFAMGIPFPIGLRHLGNTAPGLVPWAWGINGCASVISAAAATLLAAEIGFNALITVAVICYLLLPTIGLTRSRA